MKKIIIALFILLITSCDNNKNMPMDKSQKNNSQEWYVLETPSGGFKISFPEKPKREYETIYTDYGNAYSISYIYEDNEKAFMITYTDYPEEFFVNNPDKKQLLEQSLQNMVEVYPQTKLVEKKEIKINNYQGLEAKLTHPSFDNLTRIFVINNRQFILQSLYLDGKFDETAALKFLDSFQLLPGFQGR